jgi:hypothetical protein
LNLVHFQYLNRCQRKTIIYSPKATASGGGSLLYLDYVNTYYNEQHNTTASLSGKRIMC